MSEKQETKRAEWLHYTLRSVRSDLLREAFQLFWTYASPYWAGQFLDRWCRKTMRSKIEPMKKVACMLRGHRELLLNGFRAKEPLSSGVMGVATPRRNGPPEKPSGFAPIRALKSPCIMRLALYRSPSSPTDSADEPLYFSIGAISQGQGKALPWLAPLYHQIGAYGRQAEITHADKTTDSRGTERRWLWALVTPLAVYLLTHYSRGKAAARAA